MSKLSIGLAVWTAFMGVTSTTRAQQACSSPPPNPKGHIVARITSAVDVPNPGGNRLTRITLDKGSSSKVEAGDDVHFINCKGDSLIFSGNQRELEEIDKAEASTSLFTYENLPQSMQTGNLAGTYVAIDIGYESRPPAPAGVPDKWLAVRVIGRQNNGGNLELWFDAGSGAGVLPGDKGITLFKSGGKQYDLEVDWASRTASRGVVRGGLANQILDGTIAAINTKSRSCAAPATYPSLSRANSSPSGFVPARITRANPKGTDEYEIFFDKTAPQVLPGAKLYAQVLNLDPASWPVAVVTSVTSREGKATVTVPKGASIGSIWNIAGTAPASVGVASGTCK